MKKLIVVLAFFAIIFVAQNVYSQQDYQEWLKKDQQEYQDYLEEQDKAFLEFLKKDWEAFQSFKGMKADTAPKPDTIPVAPEPEPAPPEEAEPAKTEKEPEKTVTIPALDLQPPEEAPKPETGMIAPTQPKVELDFFDAKCTVNFNKNVNWSPRQPLNNKTIAQSYEALAKSNYKTTLNQFVHIAKSLDLNDWGYLLLFHTFSEKVSPGDLNAQIIMDWFLLTKAGYDVKLSYQDDQLFLLIPARHTIYELPYVTINNNRFYFIEFDHELDTSKRIYSYSGDYSPSQSPFDLSLRVLPRVTRKEEQKQLQFTYKGENIQVNLHYTRDAVDYMTDYPQTQLDIFFQSNPSARFQQSLIQALRPYVEGKSELEAVNFLLRFTQTAFDYKTDDQQFGYEKYLLPEETLYYPSSDCEDRSILFAFLVKRLIGVKVIVLDYPGHVCTAVKFYRHPSGAYVVHNGQRYTICDPTYINASAGMVMPTFAAVRPEVIEYD